MKNQLHPGAKWLFRLRAYGVLIFLMFFLSWFIIPMISILIFAAFRINPASLIAPILIGAITYMGLIILIGEIYARMSYNRWFYEFTDDNLKLERGIIWKRYSNVPYERVQNVDITRGIIARFSGFSSVMIQTAGFSYSGRAGSFAEGYIPAVDPAGAEKIREFCMKKIKGRRQGL